jgi:tetratricopeptide (TPR) repeat protein
MVLSLREEAAMSYKRTLIFVLTAMISMVAASAFAADELFDTAAASKHIEQGISFLKAKNFDAAIREFDKSAVIAPEAEAYYYLGYAHYMKGKNSDGESRKKSLENFEKAYEIDPNFTPTRYKPSEPTPKPIITRPSTTAPDEPQPAAQQPSSPEQPKP